MKIAHVTTVGVSLRYLLLNQLRTIRAAGYDVTGVSAPDPDLGPLETAGIHHIAVPMTRAMAPLSDLISLFALYRAFHREKFTIVHTHTPKGGLLGQYAALFARVPIRVHTIHGLYIPLHAKGWKRKIFVMIEKLTMTFSHYNLSQSPEDVPVAIQEGIVKADRIELLSNGIDVADFNPAESGSELRRAKRAALGFEPHHLVVGMVARLVREKGYIEILEAAQRIRTRCPEARFVFIGGVDTEKADALTPSIVDEMKLGGVAQFLGHRTDVAELYAAMDVFVLPSYREGFPRAAMEAAAMGLPAVVTDVRGCRQTVVHEKTGYLVPPRDSPALADALVALLEDPEKRRQFGAAARTKAVAEFDEQIVFARVLRAYDRLCRERLHIVRTPKDRSPLRQDMTSVGMNGAGGDAAR